MEADPEADGTGLLLIGAAQRRALSCLVGVLWRLISISIINPWIHKHRVKT